MSRTRLLEFLSVSSIENPSNRFLSILADWCVVGKSDGWELSEKWKQTIISLINSFNENKRE